MYRLFRNTVFQSKLVLALLVATAFVGFLATSSHASVPGNVASIRTPGSVTFNGSRYAFSVGGDNHVYYNVFNGVQWSGSQALIGNPTTYAAVAPIVFAIQPTNQTLYVFVTRTNGHIQFTKTSDGVNWSALADVPGNGVTNTNNTVGVTQYGNFLYLFLTGTDGRVYYQYLNVVFNAWSSTYSGVNGYYAVPNQPFSYYSTSPVSLGNYLYLFLTGHDDGHVYVAVYDGSKWSGFSPVLPTDGKTNGYVSTIAYNNQIYVFVVGTDGNLYYNTTYGTGTSGSSSLIWSGYSGIPNAGTFTNLSTGLSVYNNQLDIYYTGVDNSLNLTTLP